MIENYDTKGANTLHEKIENSFNFVLEDAPESSYYLI